MSAPPPSIYFGGCAFAAPFYAGVHASMETRWGPQFHENCILLGDSAGAIFAVGIALGKSPQTLNSIYRSFSESMANCAWTKMDIAQRMEIGIRQMVEDDELAYKRVSGRCYIGTTLFFNRHVWTTEFTDNEDLISTLLHSCRIPVYCRHSAFLAGRVDGAYSLTGQDLPHGNATLFVRVDDAVADISCTTRRLEAFWPIVGERYEELFQQGVKTMTEWDGTPTQKTQKKCHYVILCILWVLHLFE